MGAGVKTSPFPVTARGEDWCRWLEDKHRAKPPFLPS